MPILGSIAGGSARGYGRGGGVAALSEIELLVIAGAGGAGGGLCLVGLV